MWKRLLVVSAVSAAMSSMALAAPLTVDFRRSDRNLAGAPQKPMWRKVKPKSAELR